MSSSKVQQWKCSGGYIIYIIYSFHFLSNILDNSTYCLSNIFFCLLYSICISLEKVIFHKIKLFSFLFSYKHILPSVCTEELS